MQDHQLMNDVILLVKGSCLPTKQEIEHMTLEEKLQLEIEQDQIIQIFRQQALLDIWQLKIRIAKLLKETSELKAQMNQNKEIPENKKNDLVHLKNKPKKRKETKINKKEEEDSTKKTEKSQAKSNQNSKNIKIVIQNEKKETNFIPKKPKIQINTQLPNDKSKDDPKSENNTKNLETNRKPKVRNLVKKKSRLDSFNLRNKDDEKKSGEKNIPKYPFSVQQANNESKKYAYLVSSLKPKNLLLAEIQKQKDSSPNSQKNDNSNKASEKNLTKSKYQSRNKNTNQSNNLQITENIESNQPKKMKRKPTPRNLPKRETSKDKNTTEHSKIINKK